MGRVDVELLTCLPLALDDGGWMMLHIDSLPPGWRNYSLSRIPKGPLYPTAVSPAYRYHKQGVGRPTLLLGSLLRPKPSVRQSLAPGPPAENPANPPSSILQSPKVLPTTPMPCSNLQQ